MRNNLFILSFVCTICFVSSMVFSQFTKDSINIEKAFNTLIKNPDSYPSKLEELEEHYGNKTD